MGVCMHTAVTTAQNAHPLMSNDMLDVRALTF